LKASLLFRIGRPRHPLLRVAMACLALGLLALASVFVLVVAGSVLAVWLGRRAWLRLRGNTPTVAAARTEVIEGEYRVVRSRSELLPR
jgi:membrane protein implicated in regulation of membrane protease activity